MVSIELEYLQNFGISCVKCYHLLVLTEEIRGNSRSYAIFPKGAFFLFLHYFWNYSVFKRYERIYGGGRGSFTKAKTA